MILEQLWVRALRLLSRAECQKLNSVHLISMSALVLASCQMPNLSNNTSEAISNPSLSSWVQKPEPDPLSSVPNLMRLSWEGRVAINVDSTPPTKLSSSFSLETTGEEGSLRLMGPLGSTAALLTWGKNWATLQSSQLKPNEQHFSSLSELMQHWLGSPIELEELMPGLLGQESTHAGWRFDSNTGKVKMAQRLFPAPAVSIKLILDDSKTNP